MLITISLSLRNHTQCNGSRCQNVKRAGYCEVTTKGTGNETVISPDISNIKDSKIFDNLLSTTFKGKCVNFFLQTFDVFGTVGT